MHGRWSENKTTATGVHNTKQLKTKEILNHKWPNFVGHEGPGSSSKGVTLGATNHEWPFEFVIQGGTAESIEGLKDSSIKYTLKATVARGKFAYDLHAYKNVRIIRTLDPSALELAHAMTVENIWPNKIEYSIVIPQKAIVFGTAIEVDFKLTSLLKGLKIGTIRCQLIEAQEYTLPGPNGQDKIHKDQRNIADWSFELDEDKHYMQMLDEEVGQDGYLLKETLPLPKTLKKCVQDCETHGIKVRHRVKFNIALHNPDGHTSELRATLPVSIFLSPNVPLDEAGNLLDQTPNYIHSADIGSHAPPLYGDHMHDQLYADDTSAIGSGAMTPNLSSGMNTPFYVNSGNGSVENLHADGTPHTGVRPDALSTRLQNLTRSQRQPAGPPAASAAARRQGTLSGGNTPRISFSAENRGHRAMHSMGAPGSLPHINGGYFDHMPHPPPSRSNPMSRHPSSEDLPTLNGLGSGLNSGYNSGVNSGLNSGAQTPDIYTDFEDLSLNKVPSYTTAVRAPLRNMSYGDLRGLPNYATATSRPASPTRSHTTGPSTASGSNTLPVPTPSHNRTLSGHAPPVAGRPKLDASKRNKSFSHLSHLGLQALTGRRHGHGADKDKGKDKEGKTTERGGGMGEEDSHGQIHLLQARGRVH